MTALPTSRRLSSTGYTRRKIVNAVMLGLTGVATLLAIVPLVWIIAYVALEGGRFLNLDFFTQLPTPVGVPGGGIANAIMGSAMVVGIACLIAIPISLVAALYVVDHPNTVLGVAVRFGTDVLSGVPSIVMAYSLIPSSSCPKSISLRSRVGLRWPW